MFKKPERTDCKKGQNPIPFLQLSFSLTILQMIFYVSVFFGISPIHHMHRLSIQKRPYILQRHIHDPLTRFLCRPGDMGGDDTIFRFKQRIVSSYRFCGYHIQSGCVYLPRIESIGQILFMDQLSAGVINEYDSVFHLGNSLAVDDLSCVRKQRAMEKDHIS